MTTADTTVAKTILQQLGGNKFIVMTGAKNFIAGNNNDLTFRLPGGGGFCKNGINAVRIALTPADEYDLTFWRVRGKYCKVIEEVKGIYVDQLQEVFTRVTGLDTHL